MSNRFRSSIGPTVRNQRPSAPLPLLTASGLPYPPLLMSAVDVSRRSPPRPLLLTELLLLRFGFLLLSIRLRVGCPPSLVLVALTAAYDRRPRTPAPIFFRAPHFGWITPCPSLEPARTTAASLQPRGPGRRTRGHGGAHGQGPSAGSCRPTGPSWVNREIHPGGRALQEPPSSQTRRANDLFT